MTRNQSAQQRFNYFKTEVPDNLNEVMTIEEKQSLLDSQIESISHIKESLFNMKNFSPKVKQMVRPTTTVDGST